jgi:phospholipid/cholesterol/gamma-HCH transport system substrate-binding protein
MRKSYFNNIKLGIFVISGLIILILGLYYIGKDTNLFGKTYTLRVIIPDVQGLIAGNNVRYAGIQVGTVRSVEILSDTAIEVTMAIDEKMKIHIRRNDEVSLGSDALIGNRILIISPSQYGPHAEDGDILHAKPIISTNNMLEMAAQTNRNLVDISERLKTTVDNINNSTALWSMLRDPALPTNVRASIENIRLTTEKANLVASELQLILAGARAGKGTAGALLSDTSFAAELRNAVAGIHAVEEKAQNLAAELSTLSQCLQTDVQEARGPYYSVLKDTAQAAKINRTLTNIETGTASFNQNMEAMKHNFLLRGYFKKQNRQQEKETKRSMQN